MVNQFVSFSGFPAGAERGLAFDANGNLYVGETNGTDGAIGITSGGAIDTLSTFAGEPESIAVLAPLPPAGFGAMALLIGWIIFRALFRRASIA